MSSDTLIQMIQSIVSDGIMLKNKHTDEHSASVNYACLFSQSDDEYRTLVNEITKLGTKIKDTSTGPLFQLSPLPTKAGPLKLLKIRMPDITRPERGDADFTVKNYKLFKKKYLSSPGFRLIKRTDYEMIELMDKDFGVRVYFSNPPIDVQLNLV